jgi:hypothetical protein
MAVTKGTDEIDFGSNPTSEATKVVTTSGLISNDHLEAWFQHGDTTTDNDGEMHEMAAGQCQLSCKYLTGTTFEVKAYPSEFLGTGLFKFHWVRSNG